MEYHRVTKGYRSKVSVTANHMKIGGVFTEFGLFKVVNTHTLGLIAVSRGTILVARGALSGQRCRYICF